jgi:hypothetical protein
MANISTGNDGIDCHSGFPEFVQKECRVLLGALGLQDAGCLRDFKDVNLPFLKDDSDSGYRLGRAKGIRQRFEGGIENAWGRYVIIRGADES